MTVDHKSDAERRDRRNARRVLIALEVSKWVRTIVTLLMRIEGMDVGSG